MFDIVRLKEDLNLFFIVKKDSLSKSGNSFNQLPIVVYGFLSVDGRNYENSSVSYKNISDELRTDELQKITELAKLRFWNVD